MIRTLSVAALALFCVTSTAQARHHHRHRVAVTVAHPDCNRLWPCEGVTNSARGERIAKAVGFGSAQKVYTRQAERPVARRHARRSVPSYGAPTSYVAGLVAPLAAKVAEIQSSCGSKLISGVRHTYIAGTRRMSLHAEGKAADMAGNPSCIYSLLHGWSGGYSTDYGRMAHVHISYDVQNGREMGARFVHGGGHTRYAYRRHTRYASLR
jgi:hypothetical protein